MALIEFKNKPNTTTPINATNLNYNFNEILNLVFPIGRGFIDFTDTDFSNYLGFTWERELVGLTPVGLDTSQTEFNSIGKTGGEKTHTLTIDEMPRHNHAQSLDGRADEPTGAAYQWINSSNRYLYSGDDLALYSGGNQPHNNLQPYQVVAYWKRIA